MSRLLQGLLLFMLLMLPTACGGDETLLSGVEATPAQVQPSGRRPTEPISLRYRLGRPANVTVKLRKAGGGEEFVLRQDLARPAGDHFVLFNGVVPTGGTAGAAATLVRRVLPDGPYEFIVSADAGGEKLEQSAGFSVEGAQTDPPDFDNLQVYPTEISPNSDALDDVAQITYRLGQTSTTSVELLGATGTPIAIRAPERVAAGEQTLVFNGQDLLGRPVPNGVYTVTVRAEDRAGNAVAASRPLTVTATGNPNVTLLSIKTDPPVLMLGGKLHVRMVVQNTGDVPLRTQGPDSGYTYTTNDSYASIEGGRYVDQAGLWRVGLDWEGNAGGAPYRYPFRWGFGRTLAPGETVTIDGYVTILKREQTMWFYAGVLQEGIRIVQDRLGRTPIGVSW